MASASVARLKVREVVKREFTAPGKLTLGRGLSV